MPLFGASLEPCPQVIAQRAAADVPVAETNVAAATQKPIIGSVFGVAPDQAAWKTIPSWYLVTQDDRAINPDLQRFYAKRMNARTTEVKASHVPFLSQPAVVARLIEQAAAGVGSGGVGSRGQ